VKTFRDSGRCDIQLTLSVHASVRKPVIVHIHGGALILGLAKTRQMAKSERSLLISGRLSPGSANKLPKSSKMCRRFPLDLHEGTAAFEHPDIESW
jgi:hypothetical protein